MKQTLDLFKELGGEAGCKSLAHALYYKVAGDTRLRPLFPGESLRCATEEFSAFLVQFFDGDESRIQYRWWLSLRESHARFEISETQLVAWLGHMGGALGEVVPDDSARAALKGFFEQVSRYVIGEDIELSLRGDLAERWARQRGLDKLIANLRVGHDAEAINLAQEQVARRSVFVGILARMMELHRDALDAFVLRSMQMDRQLAEHRFNGRTLLHHAAGSGCLAVVRDLLAHGVDPDSLDGGGHTPIYRVAGSGRQNSRSAIVEELVRAGASVDHCGGVTKSTALHQAARHGNLSVASALLRCGANPNARDKKGLTPLARALNCRKRDVAVLLGARF